MFPLTIMLLSLERASCVTSISLSGAGSLQSSALSMSSASTTPFSPALPEKASKI